MAAPRYRHNTRYFENLVIQTNIHPKCKLLRRYHYFFLDKKYLSKADKIIGNFSMLLDEIEPQ